MTGPIYEPFENLESLAKFAESSIEKGKRYLNFFVAAELSATAIREDPFTSLTEKAEKWRAPKKPPELFINHGEFIGDGLKHIADELRNKPSSNRALYSLISQKDISGHEDDPIPSFMIFQCAVESDILYCTVYFRALEIANFFRINLEEIRLNICELLNVITVPKIRLSVFAFSAYIKPEQIPLERCRLDLLSSLDIMDIHESTPVEIPIMLEQKAKETTVVDVSGFYAIKGWLDPKREKKWPSNLNVPKIIPIVDEAIEVANELQRARKLNSHHDYIDQVSERYVQVIKQVAEEFRACLQQ